MALGHGGDEVTLISIYRLGYCIQSYPDIRTYIYIYYSEYKHTTSFFF